MQKKKKIKSNFNAGTETAHLGTKSRLTVPYTIAALSGKFCVL